MSYYELIYNDDDSRDFTRISDYDLDSFDLVSFWEQGRLDGLDVSRLRLFLEGTEHSDYLAGPLTLPIMSESFAAFLANWNDALRFAPIPNSVFSPRMDGFSVMECVAGTGPSDHVWVTCGNKPYSIIFSEQCAKATRNVGLQGFAFIVHKALSDIDFQVSLTDR